MLQMSQMWAEMDSNVYDVGYNSVLLQQTVCPTGQTHVQVFESLCCTKRSIEFVARQPISTSLGHLPLQSLDCMLDLQLSFTQFEVHG